MYCTVHVFYSAAASVIVVNVLALDLGGSMQFEYVHISFITFFARLLDFLLFKIIIFANLRQR